MDSKQASEITERSCCAAFSPMRSLGTSERRFYTISNRPLTVRETSSQAGSRSRPTRTPFIMGQIIRRTPRASDTSVNQCIQLRTILIYPALLFRCHVRARGLVCLYQLTCLDLDPGQLRVHILANYREASTSVYRTSQGWMKEAKMSAVENAGVMSTDDK